MRTDKIFKRDSEATARDVTPFERSLLENPAHAMPGPGADCEVGPADLETLRDQVLAEAMAEARDEAKRKIEEAYEKGLQRGIEAGEAQFREEVGESARVLQEAATAMRAAYDDFLNSLEPEVFELVTLIAERVVGREVRTDPEIIHATVRRAISVVADRASLTVRLNPEDAQALREHKAALLEEFEGVQHLHVEPDPEISRGSCQVDSGRVHVDARFEKLLENVLNELAD
jgi:flagellar assembly protein FliH